MTDKQLSISDCATKTQMAAQTFKMVVTINKLGLLLKNNMMAVLIYHILRK